MSLRGAKRRGNLKMIKDIEDKFKECFEYATQGETLAFPNPNVACLIYFEEKLIAKGIHREFGKAHAEVNAINELKKIFSNEIRLQKEFHSFKDFAAQCELILNLEPCSHYGNTPPCTLLIKESGFKKIAFAAYDTNPAVFKKSLEEFAGPEFILIKPEDLKNEIKEEANFINRVFFSIKEKEAQNQIPIYLTLKIASYPDGSMETKETNDWITSKESRRDVHRLRSTNQILITSSSTIKSDNPKYNVRHTAKELALLDIKDPDICVIQHKNEIKLENITSTRKVIYEKLESLEKNSLHALLKKLSFQGYQKIIIEAGPRLSHAFLESRLVDELIVYQPKQVRNLERFIREVKEIFLQNDSVYETKVHELKDDFKFLARKHTT